MLVMNEKRLIKVSDRLYYYPCDDAYDRPLLGYVRGDRYALAVDAGHSEEHLQEFYSALKEYSLPLPDFTAITHWHWDHSFAMHAVHGITIANARTNGHLRDIQSGMCEEAAAAYKQMDEHIALEYSKGQPMIVQPADLEFTGSVCMDLGGITAVLSETISPHTEDSTLVRIPEEQTLFLGDCICGNYPTWEVDQTEMDALISNLQQLPFERCLGGHWGMENKTELLAWLEENR